MSGKERLVNWIKFYSRGKPLTPKQKEQYEKHIHKVMKDFDEVWGDDLDWLDLINKLSEEKSDNPKSI